jgi:hypothetical protein
LLTTSIQSDHARRRWRVFSWIVHADDPTRSLLARLKVGLLNSIGQRQTYKALLTGHRGSSKSSELIRTGQDLVHDFFVVWFDAEQSLADTATHLEVLLGMGLAVYAAASALSR